MPRRPRRNCSPAFKAKVALEAIKGEQSIIEIAERFDVHSHVITKWKRQLLEAPGVFGEGCVRQPIVGHRDGREVDHL